MNSQIALSLTILQTPPIQDLLKARKVLLLQGPIGPFFKHFGAWLNTQQIEVSKVNFNGGDWWYGRGIKAYNYKLAPSCFDIWLRQLILEQKFDAIVCFGDCRPPHLIAKIVCQQLNIDFFAFEEGYIRPDYVTFEKQGVNSNSIWAQANYELKAVKNPKPLNANQQFKTMVGYALIYYFAMLLGKPWFLHYGHHRNLSMPVEALSWIKSGLRKITGRQTDYAAMKQIEQHFENRYFICALQVFNDYQIRIHSDYADIGEFIQQVIQSFAANADSQHVLVFKHHPMDRGYRNYTALIEQTAKSLSIASRVFYVCDVHLPTLIEHSIGMVTINSTTGMQSLYRDKPVKVMGRAIYNHPGITAQMPLDQFWRQHAQVDMSRYPLFKQNLIYFTQLNGSFYGDMPWMKQLSYFKKKVL